MCKKFFQTSLVSLAVLGLVATSATAGSLPSTKAGAATSNGTIMEASTASPADWSNVLTTYIKVAGGKELAMDLAIQCGLYTRTLVKSKGGKTSTSIAEGAVKMRVGIQELANDGVTPVGAVKYASPDKAGDGVTYCSRAQELSATFQGIFQTDEEATLLAKLTVDGGEIDESLAGSFYATMDECLYAGDASDATTLNTCEEVQMVGTCLEQDSVTGQILLDLECLAPEEVELVQTTLNANAFNFVSPNLTAGIYRVTAESKIEIDGSATSEDPLDYEAKAFVGLGSMTVDEVRFITDADSGTQ